MTTKIVAGWQIEFDKEATRAAYAKLPNDIGCTCHTCRNFLKVAPTLPNAVFRFFGELGIDLLKPPEVYENYYKDGQVFYGGFYHIVGNYLSGDDVWQPVAQDPSHQVVTEMYHVADDFDIGFTHNVAVVPEGFPEPVLQMEVSFTLPWVLDEPYEQDENTNKRDNKGFWNRYAKLYDFEIKRFNGRAYAEMYRMMGKSLSSDMDVLEVATGTGLIAVNIARFVKRVQATDFSPKMIKTAMKKKVPQNVVFSVEDATVLSFADESFDAVIISNALHIIPNPEKALSEILRVLKRNGLLIAPTYSHGHLRERTWNLNAKVLKLIGFETYSKWTPDEYIEFIGKNGFLVEKSAVLKAAFPLVYLEARKV